MLHRGILAGAIGVLAGLLAAPPAVALRFSDDNNPVTKWFPGERKPEPTTPTLPSLDIAPGTGSLVPGPFPSPGPMLTSPTLPAMPPTPAVAPTVSCRSRLEPDERRFHLGERIHFYVEVTWVGEPDDVLPEPEEPVLINLAKAVPMSQVSRLLPGATRRTIIMTFHYVLEPAEEGAASIEPIAIPCRLRDGTGALRLTTDRFALEILPRRWPWGKIALGALGALALAGGGCAATMAMVARARRAREAALVPPEPSPFERMRNHLDSIRRTFTEGAVKDGYDAIERFVRSALGERLQTSFRYATIDELSDRLAGESLDGAIRDRAASILDRCGQVKFAGYVPTVADQEQIVADCRLLLDDFEQEARTDQAEGQEKAGS